MKTRILTLTGILTGLFCASLHAAELPKSAVLKYSGSYNIPATMTFKRSGNSYTVVSEIKVPLYNIRFESGGTVNGNTLQPAYYRDVRGGKLYAEAKFNGKNVTYGKVGEQKTEAVPGNILDLFSLAWQLSANNASLPPKLHITNGKKIYPVGKMTKTGSGNYNIGKNTTPIVSYRIQRGDDTVLYSFAPEIQNIPAQIHYRDNGKNYHLNLKSVTIDGQTYKP